MSLKKQYPNLNVIPVRNVVHKRYSDLVAIRGHRNFLVNCLSGKITYLKGSVKIATGAVNIMEAKRIVEERLKIIGGMTDEQAKRSRSKEINAKISDIWNEMIEQRRVEWEESTICNYQTNWRNALSQFWGDKRAGDINEENILKYKTWYLMNKPTRYFGHTLCHFNVLLEYAKTMRHIREVPSLDALSNVDEITTKNRGREWQSDSKAFSASDVVSLLQASQKLRTPQARSRAMLGILLGVKCGMRKMEALKMKWSEGGRFAWVDFSKGVLNVWSYKNHKWREIPLPGDVKDALLNQKSLTTGPWVFPMPSNPQRHLSSQVFDKVWVQCKSLANVEGRFHDLRHTFATKTAEDGWPPVVACEILDQSLKIYQKTYCKPSAESKSKWMMMSFDGEKPQ